MAIAKPNKYLIVGPSWVGDMVMAQSLFLSIKEREPDSHIDVLAPRWTGALIDRMPEVNELIDADFQHGKLSLGARIQLGRELKTKNYSNCILLPNSLKSALVPAIAGIPTRTGFLGEQRWGLLNDIRHLNKTLLPMTVERFVELGNPEKDSESRTQIHAPELKVSPSVVSGVLSKNKLNTDTDILVLCPGAEFGASKKWPSTHYANVADHYLNQGWQVWLMGSENDLLACNEIDSLCGQNCTVLAGTTTLPDAIDLISCASLVISNDSGLMHIAAALQRPLIAVYGSTDPGHTPPLSSNHSIAQTKLDCQPCHQRECPLSHHDCMNKLTPDLVLSQARVLLQ
jgi:heptosyltransferase-2